MAVIIGIDTSCYTSSVSVVDFEENLIRDNRKILEVNKGIRGLRQSEAVFQHMNNLPCLISEAFSELDSKEIAAVSVSSRPRPVNGSYMPVFAVSNNIGSVIASSLKVPLLKFSHQEGHIRAGIWSAKGPLEKEFLCIHLSGGTTEVLKVKKENNNYKIDIVGKTLDINAGQLIDRTGVLLGLQFPCGKELECLAKSGQDNFVIPSSVKGIDMSFSGAETLIKNNISKVSPNDLAYGVQKCIAKTLEKSINGAVEKYNLSDILIVGGVASNTFIKEFLNAKMTKCTLYFLEPQYSVDNSVGTALLGVDYGKTNFNGK